MHERLLSSCVILLLSLCLSAGQTTSFTYQGRLAENGAAVSGPYDLAFKLFDQPGGGAQQGSTVSRDGLWISNGLFAVELDFGSTPLDGSPRWLEISARKTGDPAPPTVLLPRQPITAAPYAVKALAAASYLGPVADTQLSPNVALRNASQTFTAPVQFASASGAFSGTFAGNGSGLTNLPVTGSAGGAGFITGRINQLPTSAGSVFFASASGITDATATEALTTTLSPAVSAVATGLSVRLSQPPGAGNSLTFTLRVNGSDTAVSCTIAGSARTAESAAAAFIPAGSELSISIRAAGVPNSGSALFGWLFQ